MLYKPSWLAGWLAAGWRLTEGWLAVRLAVGWRAFRIFGNFRYFFTLTEVSKGLHFDKVLQKSWRMAGGRLAADWRMAGVWLVAGWRLAGGLLAGWMEAGWLAG